MHRTGVDADECATWHKVCIVFALSPGHMKKQHAIPLAILPGGKTLAKADRAFYNSAKCHPKPPSKLKDNRLHYLRHRRTRSRRKSPHSHEKLKPFHDHASGQLAGILCDSKAAHMAFVDNHNAGYYVHQFVHDEDESDDGLRVAKTPGECTPIARGVASV